VYPLFVAIAFSVEDNFAKFVAPSVIVTGLPVFMPKLLKKSIILPMDNFVDCVRLMFARAIHPCSQLKESKLGQLANALFPMLITLSGMAIEVRELQMENALFPMLVTPSGMAIEVREVQLANA